MAVELKKNEKGDKERYRLEFWIDGDGNVEENANAYPRLTRPGEGAMPTQDYTKQVPIKPSVELKALIKSEQKTVVDAELAK